MLSSVISDTHKGAFFIGMDLIFVATRTSMTCPNTCVSVPNIFLKISNSSTTLIPSWECNNQFYVKTKRCTYGLKQIDMLVYKQLARNLSHNKLYQKYKKSWNIRFYWALDRQEQTHTSQEQNKIFINITGKKGIPITLIHSRSIISFQKIGMLYIWETLTIV